MCSLEAIMLKDFHDLIFKKFSSKFCILPVLKSTRFYNHTTCKIFCFVGMTRFLNLEPMLDCLFIRKFKNIKFVDILLSAVIKHQELDCLFVSSVNCYCLIGPIFQLLFHFLKELPSS